MGHPNEQTLRSLYALFAKGEYRTSHVVQMRDGKIALWLAWPGDLAGFAAAWE
jgi:hypothetical protein